MGGIPVVIASNGRGMPVRQVSSGAPLMTIATNGRGIPIVLSTRGVPFVVQGGTPAPSFTAQPSISPGSGTANSTTFTASDGTASNATGYSHVWLLDGVQVAGNVPTYAPTSPGSLVLRVTATGPGGNTTQDSTPVTVAAAATNFFGRSTASWGSTSAQFGS